MATMEQTTFETAVVTGVNGVCDRGTTSRMKSASQRQMINEDPFAWLKVELSKPENSNPGAESLLIEWTCREHEKHIMRFL
jgi:hypothetical protein